MEREFEVGQKVRCNQTGSYCKDGELGTIVAYYNDGYVIKWDREYIEAMGSGHCKDYPPCASWLEGSELEPIPATISTMEMITALMENPKLKATAYPFAFEIFCTGSGFKWTGGDTKVTMTDGFMEAKWTLIYPTEPKPVEFLEAVNSGKRIKPDRDEFSFYRELADLFRIFEEASYHYTKELINGKWLIEGDNNV